MLVLSFLTHVHVFFFSLKIVATLKVPYCVLVFGCDSHKLINFDYFCKNIGLKILYLSCFLIYSALCVTCWNISVIFARGGFCLIDCELLLFTSEPVWCHTSRCLVHHRGTYFWRKCLIPPPGLWRLVLSDHQSVSAPKRSLDQCTSAAWNEILFCSPPFSLQFIVIPSMTWSSRFCVHCSDEDCNVHVLIVVDIWVYRI